MDNNDNDPVAHFLVVALFLAPLLVIFVTILVGVK